MIAGALKLAGILLGAHWAYAVLGWGGLLGLGPGPRCSLLPWLTGTAFLHSVMMQEKRGMMKVWTSGCVLDIYSVHSRHFDPERGGQPRSHAFAQSSIGSWFVGFLVVIFLGLLIRISDRDYRRAKTQLDAIVSRESSFRSTI